MYDLKIPKKDGLKPLKEVAAFLYLKDYELRAMVKNGTISYRRDTSVFSKNGHIYFSQKDVEDYAKSKKTYSSFVTETLDRGYLLPLEDVCAILKKDAKTVVRLGDDGVLKTVYYDSNNEKYEQTSGKKYTVESVKDFFYNNADYKHDVRILGLFAGDIRKFIRKLKARNCVLAKFINLLVFRLEYLLKKLSAHINLCLATFMQTIFQMQDKTRLRKIFSCFAITTSPIEHLA